MRRRASCARNCSLGLLLCAKTMGGGGAACSAREALVESVATMRRMAAKVANALPADSSPPRLREAIKPNLLTIAAIAIAATVIADFIHEGLGHGGMCVATGGRPLVLSTVHFECSADTRLVAAGGTLANLIFGALFWVAQRAVRQSASWRYFFWLVMAFNLFEAGGCFPLSRFCNFRRSAAAAACLS